jgi:hypothetical protein
LLLSQVMTRPRHLSRLIGSTGQNGLLQRDDIRVQRAETLLEHCPASSPPPRIVQALSLTSRICPSSAGLRRWRLREGLVQAGEAGDYAVEPGEREDKLDRGARYDEPYLSALGQCPLVRAYQRMKPGRVA